MSLAGLAELTASHTRRQKRGVLGATEREPEPYSMYGEDRSDRATTKSDAFHGASANSAMIFPSLSVFGSGLDTQYLEFNQLT
jgi:hypothetical protein